MMINRVINKIGKMSPYLLRKLLVHIPFNFRYGSVYSEFVRKVKESKNWSEEELESYIVTNFDRIFQHSKRFKLYKDKYEKSGVLDLQVKSLNDIKKIPILTRDEIREGVSDFKGFYYESTGGTTGNPLQLYLDKNAWAREWAHYHSIWGEVGYKHTDAKFVLKRQNAKDKFIRYNFAHNDYIVNPYKMTNNNIDEFFHILTTRNVKYFHGYPSAINDFLKDLERKISREQKEILQKQIVCCFYCSEYPLPHIVDYLKNEWGIDFISYYGHTEVCVLAAAIKNELEYLPLHTYGYVEIEDTMLLGTSYHNFDMPLIRYNTDDLVCAKRYTNGIVKSFKIEQGRIIDVIYDKNDLKITIHRLIMGASNKIFNHVNYIQVFQEKKGFITFLISQDKVDNLDAPRLMNLEVFNIDFDFIYLKEPIRTVSGKVPLRVQKLPD